MFSGRSSSADRDGSIRIRYYRLDTVAGRTWHSQESPTACCPATPFRHTWPGMLQALRIPWLVQSFIHDKLTFVSGRPDEHCHLPRRPAVQSRWFRLRRYDGCFDHVTVGRLLSVRQEGAPGMCDRHDHSHMGNRRMNEMKKPGM